MTDLNHMLSNNAPPAPRADLSIRILAAAESSAPANDSQSRRPWWAMGGVAAMAVAATLFWVQPADEIETDWNQIAEASGFSELYEWVEDDES